MINEEALFAVLDAWMSGNRMVSRAYMAAINGLDPMVLRNKEISECYEILDRWNNNETLKKTQKKTRKSRERLGKYDSIWKKRCKSL